MTTVHLYEPDTAFLSGEGNKVHSEVESIMEPLIKEWINDRNYNPIELISVVVGIIEYLILMKFAKRCAGEKK
jgi:hypothetical protein